ncbi:MAG: hypothetical protein QOH24_1942 [Verrucomicrobiota bacterium]|jgi:hypothetical protein
MLALGNGKLSITKATELFDRFIPDGASHAATSFVESLKINSITEKVIRGRSVIIKRRNDYGEGAADLVNFYFRLAKTHIRYVSKVREWQHWEKKCFQMLNGDRFRATVSNARTIIEDKLPGHSLWDHMNAHTLTQRMLKAAAREYRHAHGIYVDELDGGWSHGDASMPNVIYIEKTGRARLIDFEIMHERSLPESARHADDLLVFILDMVDRVPNRQWLPFALGFLRAYDDLEVVRDLKKRLVIPTGLALIWWNVRTNFANSAKVNRRFQTLRGALNKLEHHRSVAGDRARKKRRPSTNCQAIRPGIPTAKSRKRAIREIANAVSPGMPMRLPTTK